MKAMLRSLGRIAQKATLASLILLGGSSCRREEATPDLTPPTRNLSIQEGRSFLIGEGMLYGAYVEKPFRWIDFIDRGADGSLDAVVINREYVVTNNLEGWELQYFVVKDSHMRTKRNYYIFDGEKK